MPGGDELLRDLFYKFRRLMPHYVVRKRENGKTPQVGRQRIDEIPLDALIPAPDLHGEDHPSGDL